VFLFQGKEYEGQEVTGDTQGEISKDRLRKMVEESMNCGGDGWFLLDTTVPSFTAFTVPHD
jgi:hypothetical protein